MMVEEINLPKMHCDLFSLTNGWKGCVQGEAKSHYYVRHFVFIWSVKFYFYLGKVRKFEK